MKPKRIFFPQKKLLTSDGFCSLGKYIFHLSKSTRRTCQKVCRQVPLTVIRKVFTGTKDVRLVCTNGTNDLVLRKKKRGKSFCKYLKDKIRQKNKIKTKISRLQPRKVVSLKKKTFTSSFWTMEKQQSDRYRTNV